MKEPRQITPELIDALAKQIQGVGANEATVHASKQQAISILTREREDYIEFHVGARRIRHLDSLVSQQQLLIEQLNTSLANIVTPRAEPDGEV